jgi:Dolichyl-phosphate-mannose-protein mannosyltransferase
LSVAGLLALHAACAINSLMRENPTIDEVVHLPAGITYWQTGTFKLYHHNPPLIKLVAAVPALLSAPVMDPLYQSVWWKSDPPNKAGFAHEFAERNAHLYFELFERARLVMPLFSVLGGLIVFLWSRRLFGAEGGLLSLTLWTFCPNLLAHARLITTDVGATSLGVGATYLFSRYLEQPSWRRAALAGLALGFAELSKFSMLLLYAVWPFLWLVRELFTWQGAGAVRRLVRAVAQGLLMVAISVLTIDIGYGFEDVGQPLGRFEFVCGTLTRPVATGDARPRSQDQMLDLAWRHRVNRFRGTLLELLPVPLPKHYVLGFDDQKLEAEGIPKIWLNPRAFGDPNEVTTYPVYLDGVLRQTGWWYYYFDALAYKVPEGTLALVGLALLVLACVPRARVSWPDEITLLTVPVIVMSVMSFGTNINLGLRYVLPVFPYLFISAGRLAPWSSGIVNRAWRRAARIAVGGCAAATVLSAIWIHPHYLAYFNWASGGPSNGSAHLIDSNLDWGQDLVNLRSWLRAHAPDEPVGLAYFGQINPRIFAARGDPISWYLAPARPGTVMDPPPPNRRVIATDLPPSHRPGAPGERLRPGLYAVSASLVRGLPWRVYDNHPTRWAPWEAKEHAFSYFEKLTPTDSIGHSIFIYRVTPEIAARLSYIWPDANYE